MGDERTGYRTLFRHPVARRLVGANALSSVGDFVGLGALLLIAYDRAGGLALGPAALFAAQAVPGLLAGTVASGLVARISPRGGLVAANLFGAVSLLLVLLVGGLWPVFATATLLGAVRAVVTPLTNTVVVRHVPGRSHTALFGLQSAAFQTAQVIGFVCGGWLAVGGRGGVAIVVDIATFLAAAVVYARLPAVEPVHSAERRRPLGGLRAIRRHPLAWALIPSVWASMMLGAVPEAMTTSLVDGAWIGPVTAGAAASSAVGALLLARSGWLDSPRTSLRLAVAGPVTIAAIGVAASVGSPAVVLLAGHLALGVAAVWTIGAASAISRTVPACDISQVTSTMMASLLVLEGVGALAVAGLTDLFGPLAGYGITAAVAAVPLRKGLRRCPSDAEFADLVAASSAAADAEEATVAA